MMAAKGPGGKKDGKSSPAVTQLNTVIFEYNQSIDEASKFLTDALDTLLHSSGDNGEKASLPNKVWIQLLHRSLDVWNVHAIPQRFLRKFIISNDQVMSKAEELESSVSTLLELMTNHKEQLHLLDCVLEVFPNVTHLRDSLTRSSYNNSHIRPMAVETREFESLDKNFEPEERLLIQFVGPVMEISLLPVQNQVEVKQKKVYNLAQFPEPIQAEIISTPIFQLIRVINKVILSIKAAHQILDFNITTIQEILLPSSPIRFKIPKFRDLESALVAILINTINSKMEDLLHKLINLEENIGNFTSMIHLIQIQAAGRKLISTGKHELDEVDKMNLQAFRETLTIFPSEFEIFYPGLKREYSKWLQHALEAPKNVGVLVDYVADQKMPKVQNIPVAFPKLLNCSRDAYLKNLLDFLHLFERLTKENSEKSLSTLICPKASQRIGEKKDGIGSKPLGFVEGLSFLIRETVQSVSTNDDNSYPPDMDYVLDVELKLYEFEETILEFDELIKTIHQHFSQLRNYFAHYRQKLPQDMSFLDDKIKPYSIPDLTKMIVNIWKKWNNSNSLKDEKPTEVELRWKSTNKKQIKVRSSTRFDKSVTFSTMSIPSQIKTIMVLMDATLDTVEKALGQMSLAEIDLEKARQLFKYVCCDLFKHERNDRLTPSDVYTFCSLFEHHTTNGVICFQEINSIVTSLKAGLASAKLHFRRKSKAQLQPKVVRRYPEFLLINVVVPSDENVDEWLVEKEEIPSVTSVQECSGDERKSEIQIKSSSTVQISQSSTSGSVTTTTTISTLEINAGNSNSNQNTYENEVADILEELYSFPQKMTSVFQITNNFLLTPNVSLIDSEEISHFTGILKMLACTILEISHFPSRIPQNYRNLIVEKSKLVEMSLKKFSHSKTTQDIQHNLIKIQEYANSFENTVRQKLFPHSDVSRSISELSLTDPELENGDNDGKLELSASELAEHIASKTKTTLWNVVLTKTSGICIKHHTSQQKYSLYQLNLKEQLQFITSVTKYITEILKITDGNMQTCKKRLTSTKTSVKEYSKKVPLWIKQGKITERNAMQFLLQIRNLKNGCDVAEFYFDQFLHIMAEGAEIVSNIVAYLHIIFKLRGGNSNFAKIMEKKSKISPRIREQYHIALELEKMEFRKKLEQCQDSPIRLEVPLMLDV